MVLFCPEESTKPNPVRPLLLLKPVSQAKTYAKSLHILFHGKEAQTPYMSIIMLINTINPAELTLAQLSFGW